MRIIGVQTKTVPTQAVLVTFVEGNLTRLIRNGKKEQLEIGVGKKKDIDRRKLALVARQIVRSAKEHKIKHLAISFSDFLFPKVKTIDSTDLASFIAQNFELANFEFTRFKKKPKTGWPEVELITILTIPHPSVADACIRGQKIGHETNKCRGLSNTPGGDMTPTHLAQAAKKAVEGTKATVKVLGKAELKKLKMGAILGVSKGSTEEPRFIIMEYWGAGKSAKGKNTAPIVLVGKGVTFDTGGLNIKKDDGMLGMHLDMTGGAVVIHALALAARLKLKKNVIALVPAVENMLSGESYRPGDILYSMSGKTIEVLNTDAEGRAILADALTYAKRYKPRLVVDVATLTGAVLIALGQHASAVMSNDEKLLALFQKLGEESGEYVWPFPLWDEYEQYVKGNFADLANIPPFGNTRYGGVVNAGMFLYQFVENYPWVHMDIASRMTAIPSDKLAKGATGEPLRLLFNLLESF